MAGAPKETPETATAPKRMDSRTENGGQVDIGHDDPDTVSTWNLILREIHEAAKAVAARGASVVRIPRPKR